MVKTTFIKVYSSLPDGIRREVIAVIDNKPYTWDAAYIEILQDTPLGKKILEQMVNLGLIKDEK